MGLSGSESSMDWTPQVIHVWPNGWTIVWGSPSRMHECWWVPWKRCWFSGKIPGPGDSKWPFWDGETWPFQMVVGDLQRSGIKLGHKESPGWSSFLLREIHTWIFLPVCKNRARIHQQKATNMVTKNMFGRCRYVKHTLCTLSFRLVFLCY